MIGKVTRGTDARRLLQYLYGPGRANEHTDPHLVAGFGDPAELEPEFGAGGVRDLRRLSGLLAQPLAAVLGPALDKPVWHCSVRAAPGDRMLSDAEWARVAGLIMDRTGLASLDDEGGVRWVAVRHAADHIHIVATLARQDGRRARIWNDFYRVREACQEAERIFGLQGTAPADRTAPKRPTRAESEQTARRNWREPPRVTLRKQVSLAAAAASSEQEFFAILRQSGVQVRLRYSTKNPGEITGYAVGLARHTNQDGGVVWYSGGKLAADLTLPKLRHRWRPTTTEQPPRQERFHDPNRNAAYEHAAREARRSAEYIRRCTAHDPRSANDAAWATADALRITARILHNPALRHAADAFDRAARAPHARIPRCSTAGDGLRLAARALWAIRTSSDSSAQVTDLILSLLQLVETIAELRATQRHTAQATAARQAAGHLHTVLKNHDAPPTPTHNQQRAPHLAQQDGPAVFTPTRPSTQRKTSRPTPPRQHRRPGRGP
jgi:hypothetical protein